MFTDSYIDSLTDSKILVSYYGNIWSLLASTAPFLGQIESSTCLSHHIFLGQID